VTTSGAAARDELLLRAAHVTEVALSDVEGGIARYQKILAASPTNHGAREALWNVARGSDYRLPAIAALDPVLRAGRDWDGLVELPDGYAFHVDPVSIIAQHLEEFAALERSAVRS
jgi:hypothetical protein